MREKKVMKLEVGKSYCARCGVRVDIIGFTPSVDRPVAAWFHRNEDPYLCQYTRDGHANPPTCSVREIISDMDIVSEWKEEPLCICGPGIFLTRDGKKAEVTRLLSIEVDYPVKGYVSQDGVLKSWDKKGAYSDFDHPLDLVKRIKE